MNSKTLEAEKNGAITRNSAVDHLGKAARVLESQIENGLIKYYITYPGTNRRFDKWVDACEVSEKE